VKNNPKLNFMMLIIFIVLSIALAVFAYLYGGVDFGVYYAAGRIYLQGGNPYDYSQLSKEIISSTGILNNPFYYAPWFVWFMLPFSIFPYSIARLIWALVNFVLWFFGLFVLEKIIEYPQTGWRRWWAYLLVTFVFAWSTWGFEQVGILIFFMFTLVLLFVERGKWNALGILLALLLFKPNITALPIACILLWLILRGNWKSALVMGSALGVMLLITVIISPNWYLALLQPDKVIGLSHTLDSSGGIEITRYNTTLLDFLAAYNITGNAVNVIYTIIIVLGITVVAMALFYSKTILQVAAITLLVNFAVIPYALFYDYPVLVITLFFANLLLLQRSSLTWVRGTANLLVVMSLFIGNTISYRYWIVIILALFMAIAIFFRKDLHPLRDTRANTLKLTL
jgi:hypothetical protein